MAHPSIVELGRLDLVSTTTGLRLELVSELAVSTRSETGQPQLVSNDPTPDTLQKSFVQRADGFRVVLDVKFGMNLSVSLQDDLIEKLGSAIKQASLWTQLQLVPLSIMVSASASPSVHHMTICLSYADITAHTARKARHKLGIDVPFHNVRPPSGVRTFSLENAHLKMHISDDRLRKRERRLRRRSASSMLSMEDSPRLRPVVLCHHTWNDAQDTMSRDLSRYCGCGTANKSNPENANHVQRSQSNDKAISSSLSSNHGRTDLEMRFLMPTRTTPSLKRAWSSLQRQSLQATLIDTADIVQFLASGVREAISGLPRRQQGKVQQGDNNSLLRLADIAPALFNPGYLSNVSSRAVFIPLLSHALLNIGFRNANTVSLRSKISGLLHVDSTMNPTARHDNPDQETLASRLFRFVQRGVLDPKAATRLEPIIVLPDESPPLAQVYTTRMLDPVEEDEQGQNSIIIDHNEFDDLWDDGESDEIFSMFNGFDVGSLNTVHETPYTESWISSQERNNNPLDSEILEPIFCQSNLGEDLTNPAFHSNDSRNDDNQDDLLSITDGSF